MRKNILEWTELDIVNLSRMAEKIQNNILGLIEKIDALEEIEKKTINKMGLNLSLFNEYHLKHGLRETIQAELLYSALLAIPDFDIKTTTKDIYTYLKYYDVETLLNLVRSFQADGQKYNKLLTQKMNAAAGKNSVKIYFSVFPWNDPGRYYASESRNILAILENLKYFNGLIFDRDYIEKKLNENEKTQTLKVESPDLMIEFFRNKNTKITFLGKNADFLKNLKEGVKSE